MRLLDGKPWVHSTATRVGDTMRAHGFKGPEALAAEAEATARMEGAYRCMRKLQAASATVAQINKARKVRT